MVIRAAKGSQRMNGDAGRSAPAAFGGALIGALGGLIGLGGAEFRLPLLIGAFRFAALQAVILNKRLPNSSFPTMHADIVRRGRVDTSAAV